MKAWTVHGHDIEDGALLVFAPTKGAAQAAAIRDGTYGFTFRDVRALRAPSWDRHADCQRVVTSNDALPDAAPPFYGLENDGWGDIA